LLVEGQAFAESQDYGVHGERVRKACWGYLCRGGAVELREVSSIRNCIMGVIEVGLTGRKELHMSIFCDESVLQVKI
jgi:hypothetical protein